jgi:hypothetical protein
MTTVLGARSNYLPAEYTSGLLRLALNVYFWVHWAVWGPLPMSPAKDFKHLFSVHREVELY